MKRLALLMLLAACGPAFVEADPPDAGSHAPEDASPSTDSPTASTGQTAEGSTLGDSGSLSAEAAILPLPDASFGSDAPSEARASSMPDAAADVADPLQCVSSLGACAPPWAYPCGAYCCNAACR